MSTLLKNIIAVCALALTIQCEWWYYTHLMTDRVFDTILMLPVAILKLPNEVGLLFWFLILPSTIATPGLAIVVWRLLPRRLTSPG